MFFMLVKCLFFSGAGVVYHLLNNILVTNGYATPPVHFTSLFMEHIDSFKKLFDKNILILKKKILKNAYFLFYEKNSQTMP